MLIEYKNVNWWFVIDKAHWVLKLLQRILAILIILFVLTQGVYQGILTGTFRGFLYWSFAGVVTALVFVVIFLAIDLTLYFTEKSSDWLTDQFTKFATARRWVIKSFAVLLFPLAFVFIYIYWNILDNVLIVGIFLYCVLLLPSALIAVERVASSINEPLSERQQEIITELQNHISKINDTNTVDFLEEAVTCLENKLYRASVVLSWVGAISLLHNYIVNNHLETFNAEAVRRNSKWRPAKTSDDLAKMKESDFLDIMEAISVIGKNVKQELQNSLQLRNACGHPNSLELSQNKVAAHLEILTMNVFSKFT